MFATGPTSHAKAKAAKISAGSVASSSLGRQQVPPSKADKENENEDENENDPAGRDPCSSRHVQLDCLYAPAVASSARPESNAALSSAHIAMSEPDPNFSAAQSSVWSEDRFMAAYQHYFVPCNNDDCDAGSPQDSDYLDWSIPSAPTQPIDLPPLEHIDSAEYAYTQYAHTLFPSAVPEEAYTAMHVSPRASLSSYLELAQAARFAPYNFADDYAAVYQNLLIPRSIDDYRASSPEASNYLDWSVGVLAARTEPST